MAGILRRPQRHARNRRAMSQGNRIQRGTPVSITSATYVGSDVTVTFSQPVSLQGIPKFLKNGSTLPTAAVMTSNTTLVLTFPGTGATLTLVVPFEDPCLRSSSAGFVLSGTVNVSPASEALGGGESEDAGGPGALAA